MRPYDRLSLTQGRPERAPGAGAAVPIGEAGRDSRAHLLGRLSRDGWARRAAAEMKAVLGADESAWRRFAGGWDAMPLDTYMADGGSYRRRRYGVFHVGPRLIAPVPAQPHYQSLGHNRLNGGIDRWFAPLSEDVAGSLTLARILECCRELYAPLAPAPEGWRVEVHQFRIEAAGSSAGLPTPEGRHRDGVTAGFAMLIARNGVEGGVTRLWEPCGRSLASFTMTEPGEALFFDDRRIFHDVTPISAAAEGSRGHRDVLIVTFAQAN